MALTQTSTNGIKDATIATADIAADAITGAKIADDSVGAEHIEVLDAALQLGDNVKVQFGTGNDFDISFNGTNGWIDCNAGSLYTDAEESHFIRVNGNEDAIKAVHNGGVELYYNNVKKFETTSSGATLSGYLNVPTGDSGYGSSFGDNVKAGFGDVSDLQIFHDGSNSYISDTSTGNLKLTSNGTAVQIEKSDGENMAIFRTDGAVGLYHNNVLVFDTDTNGITILGPEGGDGLIKLYADEGDDNADKWQIVSNTNGSWYLQDYSAGTWGTNIKCTGNNSVELYYGNTKRLETTSTGAVVTGVMQAYKDASDSDYTGTSWHVLHSDTNSNTSLIVEHSGDSTPYGIFIDFSDASPDDSTRYFINCQDSSASRFVVYSDGDVWNHDNSYTGSDETLKENIVDATPKLEDLKKLKVRNFNWKSEYFPEKSKKKQLGFIAQEVEEVFPSLVSEHDIAVGSPDNSHTPVMKKAIKQAWDPIIIKAMQELIAKVETLETKVAALEAA